MRTLVVFALVAVTSSLVAATTSAQKAPLGKLFIKAAPAKVGNEEFPDAKLQDSIKDMKNRNDKKVFTLVDKESDADFLITILERHEVGQIAGDRQMAMTATLSIRDADGWKPAAKISQQTVMGYARVAQNVLRDAEKWIVANKGK